MVAEQTVAGAMRFDWRMMMEVLKMTLGSEYHKEDDEARMVKSIV
jgi:hypothetical protein